MATRKKKGARRKAAQTLSYKDAYVSINALALGWAAPGAAGRTVKVIFRDGDGAKLGELTISAARVRWWGPHSKRAVIVAANRLDELFRGWR